jgi:hypothetical protein
MHYIRLIAIALVIASSVAAKAQTIHVISVADVDDPFIGRGTAANSQLLQKAATVISLVTKMAPDFSEVRGPDFKCSDILTKIGALQSGPDDVVIFYYSGHGFAPISDPNDASKPAQSAYPWFYCKPDPGKPRPNFESITGLLAAKNPRLLISVADTCNVILPITEPPSSAKGLAADSIREMYTNFKGTIMISSSIRGQKSWYLPSGGLFSARFIPSLIDPPDVGKDAWKALIKQATETIHVQVEPEYTENQQPQATLNLTYTPR